MGLIRRLADVRVARRSMAEARGRLMPTSRACMDRARAHPLIWLGAAAGSGFVLGRLAVRIWRVPGVLALLSGEAFDTLGQWASAFTGADDDGAGP